jgi:hypothetical protein
MANFEYSRDIATLFIGLVGWQIVAAYVDGWGASWQLKKRGVVGMSICQHGSIWGDVFLWWIMATIWHRYPIHWNNPWIVSTSIGIGIVVTAAMMRLWKQGNQMEPHQQTSAGIPLAIQLGVSVGILWEFFVFTKGASSDFSLLVCVLMLVYVFLSTHIILGACNPELFPINPAKNPHTWQVLTITFVALALGFAGQQNNWWDWWRTY